MISNFLKNIFSKSINQENVQEFMDEAENLLDDEQYDDAIELGKKIAKIYSGGTEIIARSYVYKGDSLKAIGVLEEALSMRPQIWPLWDQLGSIYSDIEQFEKSLTSYKRALNCENCDTHLISINISIMYLRQGDYEKAESSLNVDQNPYRLKTMGMLIDIYSHSKQMSKAQELIDSLDLSQFKDFLESSDYDTESDLARVYYDIGNFYRLKDNQSLAIKYAINSLKIQINESALWLVRTTKLLTSDSSKYFDIEIEGTNQQVDSSEPAGFYRNLEIVADTKEEALTFALEIEPLKDNYAVTLDEAEVKLDEYLQPKGVYWMSGCVFYEED